MNATGIFVSAEELETVKVAQQCSGMWLSGGAPLGDPAREVKLLTDKYNPPEGSGLSLKDGQFYKP